MRWSDFFSMLLTSGMREEELPDKKIFGTGSYEQSLILVIAVIARANGQFYREELNLIKHFLNDNFTTLQRKEMLQTMKKNWRKTIALDKHANVINKNVKYVSKLRLLNFLYKLAALDKVIDRKEEKLLIAIAKQIGINEIGRENIRYKYRAFLTSEKEQKTENEKNKKQNQQQHENKQATQEQKRNFLSDYYQILEIEETATIIEIKKAYRQMAIKYHPDKVLHQTTEIKQIAKERFLIIQDAYHKLKKYRNFN